MTTSLPRAASSTVTAFAPVSAARPASVSGPARVGDGDVVTECREAAGEVAADVAGADDADAEPGLVGHGSSPSAGDREAQVVREVDAVRTGPIPSLVSGPRIRCGMTGPGEAW